MEREIHALAKRAAGAVKKADRLSTSLFQRFMFRMMILMMKKNKWNPRDKEYWQAHGWMDGARPF